jgi:putative endonuclease
MKPARLKAPRTHSNTPPISRENPRGTESALATRVHGIEKRIVYILRSDVKPSRHYVGITNDLRARLEWHNHGPCGHTLSHRPWSVVVSLEFPTEKEAVRFEKYLKSGSGRAFATRHFGPDGPPR